MSQVDSPLLPLPVKGVSHAVVFFESMPKNIMGDFTKRLREDYPELQALDPARWGAASEPRAISFGELCSNDGDEGWRKAGKWHLLIDSQGVAPEVKQAILDGPQTPDERMLERLDEAGVAVMVFLLTDPEQPSTPMTKIKSLCRPIWRFLEMGATGVAFPEAGTMITAETLKLMKLDELGAGHSYLFISTGLAERSHDMMWFRTQGMAQFGLPDLCHGVPKTMGQEKGKAEDLEAHLTATRLVMETLPPAMIAEGGVLPIGGEVQVGEKNFIRCPAPEKAPDMVSRFGFCFLKSAGQS